MTASERLRELDGVATNGPWKITTFDFAPGRFWLEGPPAEGYEGEIPEPDAKLITTLRNALPLIADVVEAAEYAASMSARNDPARLRLLSSDLSVSLTALRDALGGGDFDWEPPPEC